MKRVRTGEHAPLRAPATIGADELLIRPIAPDDKDAMASAFGRLSDHSRCRRFLSPRGPLSPSELRYFTEVDHHDHEALVAVDERSDEGVGVARYVRSDVDPTMADLAVAVVDDWQGRGVGTRLTAALAARARAEGIRSFTALMLAENESMRAVIDGLGEVREQHAELGTVEVIVDLPETGLGRLARLLKAVARGELVAFPRLRRSES